MKTLDPGQTAGAPGAPADAVPESGRRDDGPELGLLGVTDIPVQRVGVADALAEVLDGAVGGLFVKQADAILPGPVEVAQPGPQPVDAFLGDHSLL